MERETVVFPKSGLSTKRKEPFKKSRRRGGAIQNKIICNTVATEKHVEWERPRA
jgi:hypothetical protein